MSPTSDPSKSNRTLSAFNLTLVTVAGLVGFLTLVIVLAALFGGLWLDNQFDTRPMFSVGLMIVSVPITLIMMFWVVRAATSHLQTSSGQDTANRKEDVISE